MSGKQKTGDAQPPKSNELGIVTSTIAESTRHKQTRHWVLILVALIVSVVAVSSYAIHRKNQADMQAQAQQQATAEAQNASQSQFVATNQQNQADLEAQLKTAKTPEEKSQVYIGLSGVASNQNNQQAALDYAQKAVAASPTLDSYVTLGAQAMDAGQYKVAAAAYGKAAELYKASGGPTDDRYYQTYIDLQKEAESHL